MGRTLRSISTAVHREHLGSEQTRVKRFFEVRLNRNLARLSSRLGPLVSSTSRHAVSSTSRHAVWDAKCAFEWGFDLMSTQRRRAKRCSLTAPRRRNSSSAVWGSERSCALLGAGPEGDAGVHRARHRCPPDSPRGTHRGPSQSFDVGRILLLLVVIAAVGQCAGTPRRSSGTVYMLARRASTPQPE